MHDTLPPLRDLDESAALRSIVEGTATHTGDRFFQTLVETAAHLLFAVATTAYILIAIRLEERDLAEVHGERYAEYRRSVPMLVPRVRVTQPAATKVARTEVA